MLYTQQRVANHRGGRLTVQHHQIIISVADEAVSRSAAMAIWRPELGIRRVPWGAPLAALVTEEKCDVIVAEMPRSTTEVGALVRKVRQPTCPSRRLGFIALAAPDTMGYAVEFLGRGINRIVPTDRIHEDLETTLIELLSVAPRRWVGAPATIKTIEQVHSDATECHIENASSSGILVRCGVELSAGSVIEFSMDGSDGGPPIRGRATICRATRPGLDPVTGYGARLMDFVGADRGRYETLLAQAG